MTLFKLINVYEFEPLDRDGEPVPFRVEILSDGTVYTARFYRHEFLRVQPTFPQHEGEPNPKLLCDEMILIRDPGLGAGVEALREESEGALLRKIAARIAEVFPDAGNG